jgi:hypothetical protein
MKQLFFILGICLAAQIARSQTGDTLRIYWNKQLLLDRNSTGKDSPVITIKKIWLQKKTVLEISFKMAGRANNWRRTFQFTDTVNNIFIQKEFGYTRGNYIFSSGSIKPLLQKNKKLLLYTFQQPPAHVSLTTTRIERYLLCKLILE